MPRQIRIASVSMAQELRRPENVGDNLAYIEETVAAISPLQPDLIVLPEVFPTAGLPSGDAAIPQDPETIQRLATRYDTHVAGSLYEARDGQVYNTLVVADRKGVIVGRYDKIHPTENEIARGVTPGQRMQSPIETDLGLLGAQICFDANWPQDWQDQVAQGAEMIMFSSAFPGGQILEALALLNTVYVVPAIWSLHSGIIDNTGRWLVQTDRFSRWVSAVIDLDRTVFHWDFQGDRLGEIRAKYGPRVQIETYGPEAWFVLQSHDPDVSVADIAAEFALVTYREYIRRATMAQDAARPKTEVHRQQSHYS